MELKQNEKIEDLEFNGLKVIQSKNGFRIGTDAVLLADFAKRHIGKSFVLDIGTGTGVISILLAGKTDARKIIGLDVQEAVCDMARRSVKLNNLNDRIEIVCSDVKQIVDIVDKHTVDIIVTNPPYQRSNSGITNGNESELISRHEVLCTFDDICVAANYALRPKGEMYIVHRPERLVDIFYSLRKNEIEPKEIRFVESHSGEKAVLLLIKAVKGGKPFLNVLDPLIIYNKDGSYTEEVLKIYGK